MRFLPELLSRLDENHAEYEVLNTTHSGHAEELARQHAQAGTIVVAIGGDGTVNEVLRGVLGSPSFLGICPCGSGNDIAQSLGISRKNAIQTLLDGTPEHVSVGMVNDHPFLGVASCGLDTEVNCKANQIPRIIKGPLLYTVALLWALITFKAVKIEVSLPDSSFSEEIMLLAVGQGDRYGGGMKITPKALREDGLLDLCLVQKISKWQLLTIFPKVFSGNHIYHPKVRYYQTPELLIQGTGDVYADGDRKTQLPARYEIRSDLLSVILPSTHPN